MHHLTYPSNRRTAASPEIVYDLLIDVLRWPDWLPGVRSAVWEEAGTRGGTREGAICRIVISGLTMREKILIDDGPHHHAYRIVSGIPVTHHRADVHINERAGGSLIVWQATFRSRIPFAGPLIWLMLRTSMPRMATALATGAEQADQRHARKSRVRSPPERYSDWQSVAALTGATPSCHPGYAPVVAATTDNAG